MIDTNQILQAAQSLSEINQAATQARMELNPWLPVAGIALAWVGGCVCKVARWADQNVERVVAHGGVLRLIGKFFYNKNP